MAYKPNSAFYECRGAEGWEELRQTCRYIKEKYPNKLLIIDCKRGDIGNTAKMYAKAMFEDLQADAVTIAPYMGSDSVMPFLAYEGKWVILLDLTSNPSASDFQLITDADNTPLLLMCCAARKMGRRVGLKHDVCGRCHKGRDACRDSQGSAFELSARSGRRRSGW